MSSRYIATGSLPLAPKPKAGPGQVGPDEVYLFKGGDKVLLDQTASLLGFGEVGVVVTGGEGVAAD